jgi:protein-S-isoprenylcysteine O-methyltransferase Ste14
MYYIVLGILGFALIHLFDIVSLKRLPLAKPATWFVGCVALIYAIVAVCVDSPKLPLPVWSVVLGWVLLLPGLGLQVHALFVSLPFGKTYLARGVGSQLVTTGLYGLVRHPGVYGFSLAMLSLVLISRSRLMLLAGLIWVLVDIILVVLQDKVFFGRMFPGYAAYCRQTPMLIPNWQTLSSVAVNFKLSDLNKNKRSQGENE